MITIKSLNRVTIIGNVVADPSIQATKTTGTSVANFAVATNREYLKDGEKVEDTEFHRIIAWSKLADICGQLLRKGSKVYVEGRLANRKYVGSDNIERTTTEIVADDVIVLDYPEQEE